MKISTTHKRFADLLKDQTALEYPERFLGPNWKDVLNFWIYLDTLSYEDNEIITERYRALGDSSDIRNLSWKAAEDTIGVHYTDGAWAVVHRTAYAYAILELIGSDTLESFNFLPLFLNL